MSAERDARMLAHLRGREGRHAFGTVLTAEEFDLLLRIADERDRLAAELCEEQQGRGRRPINDPTPDSKYIVRECASCHHEPHGIGFLCSNLSCGCRNERPTQ